MPRELTGEELYEIRRQVFADSNTEVDDPDWIEIKLMARITKKTMEAE